VSVYISGEGLATIPESHDHGESHDHNESHDPDESPPGYYQICNEEKKPPSSSDVTMTVTFSKDEVSALPENEKQPHPPAEKLEHNGSLPHVQLNSNDVTKLDHVNRETVAVGMTTTDQPNVTDGTAAVGATATLTTNNTSNEKNPAKLSPTTRKKGLFGLRLLGTKEKPRRDSQKPLLNSQSSTTPGDRYEYSLMFP